MLNDKNLIVLFLLFVFAVFLIHQSPTLSGRAIDVGHRFCTDSDEGLRPYTPGFIKSDIGTFNDRCLDNLHQIREYYCDAGPQGGRYRVASHIVSCGSGYTCIRNTLQNADACINN